MRNILDVNGRVKKAFFSRFLVDGDGVAVISFGQVKKKFIPDCWLCDCWLWDSRGRIQ